MLVQTAALAKRFQMGENVVTALQGVDLAVPENAFCQILGPSGSGKSTLLHLLGGLDRPSQGSIQVDGEPIDRMDENGLARFRRQKVGFIFQSYNLITSMTALENVSFPMQFAGIPKRQRKARAQELLERVGMADRADHKPGELSGGQQQRVAVARALVNTPRLILADEPTGNLDTASGENIMELLAELQRDGATVVMVTHDTRLTKFSTHQVHLLDGRIVPSPNGKPKKSRSRSR
ncbi:MAG: ABC transporter ATP-binding protein [Chloroflexi bacterium]|nr:ABC transporter ATP-binding protein [Chloroflexota bacterium]